VTVRVRPARPAEYAEIGRITADGYRADGLLTRPDGSTDTGYELLLLDAARRAGEAELLVAVDRRTVLGTVTWCPPGSAWRQLARAPDQGEFRMLSVAPAGRRRGVGRALVAAGLDRARSAGMRQVLLLSLPAMTAAHTLYRQFGFVRDPGLDWSPDGHLLLWGFRLDLGPG
jgi:GNAT superfamily N-acetyltransferase